MRFINHSCVPNCIAYEIEGDDGLAAIEIDALRPIAPGGELLLDYRLEVGEEAAAADYACRCGTRRCRGTLRAAAGG